MGRGGGPAELNKRSRKFPKYTSPALKIEHLYDAKKPAEKNLKKFEKKCWQAFSFVLSLSQQQNNKHLSTQVKSRQGDIMKHKTVITYEYEVYYYKANSFKVHKSLADALKHVHTLVKYGFDATLRIRQYVSDDITCQENEKAIYYTRQFSHRTSLTSYTFVKVPHYTIIRRFYH